MLPLLRIGTQARWTPMTTEGRATIIVISHNRRVQLLSTLKSLQQLPGNWPIIVIDNGSTDGRSEEHTSELQSLMRISYAVFCLKKKTIHHTPLKQLLFILQNKHRTTHTTLNT